MERKVITPAFNCPPPFSKDNSDNLIDFMFEIGTIYMVCFETNTMTLVAILIVEARVVPLDSWIIVLKLDKKKNKKHYFMSLVIICATVAFPDLDTF